MKNAMILNSGKRLLAVLMTLVLLVGLLPVYALAADAIDSPEAFAQAVADAKDGDKISFTPSEETLNVGMVSVEKNITIVLSGQTLKGSFDIPEGKTLTVKGKGNLKSEDMLFLGAGTVVIDLDGEVSAPAITTVAMVGEGESFVVTLVLKRGAFDGSIARPEDKNVEDFVADGSEYTAGEGNAFTVKDKAAPVITAGNATRLSDTEATVSLDASEDGTYKYSVTDENGEEVIAETGAIAMDEGKNTITISQLKAGLMKLVLWAEDNAGNKTMEAETCDIPAYVPKTYTVTLPTPGEEDHYTIAAEEGSVSPVTEGGSYSFKVTPAAGYGCEVKANDVLLTAADGVYKIENIQADQTVTVTAAQTVYTVTPPTGEGFTFTGETSVAHGADYTFTVALAEGYEKLEVMVNGTVLEAVEGVYTVPAVTAAPEIAITAGKSSFAITTEGEGFTLDPVTTEVEYGGSYTFAVKPNEGWKIGEAGLTVTVGETALTAADGKYTVENITAATVIKVAGMERITYTVTLPTGEGFTVTADSGSNTVNHGEDFHFTVTVDDANGYVVSPDFAVKVGDTALTGEHGRYTIPAVTADQTVTVAGVSLSSFNIQVSTGGYTITAMAGSKNPAPYGSSYKFKLELKPGYMKTADFAVKANSTPLTADSSGVYTVENIRANTTIEIFGVSNGSYNITFSSDASYKVTPVNSTLPVAYNGSYSFKVEPNPGYVRGNAFAVKQDGLAMSPDANGIYTIYNIQQDHNVTISGMVAASTAVSYSVTLSGGTGYSYTAQNGSTSPVAPGGSYSFKVNLANGYTKGTNFAVKVNGNSLTANNNGVYTISNINANQTVTVTGVIKSAATGGGTTVAAAPAVTTSTLPNGTMGTAYNQTLKANGQNITWSYTGTLPNGLTLNTGTGVISGTPTLNGTFRFAVKATNTAGSNTKQLTITVTGEEYKATIDSDNLKEGKWEKGTEDGILFNTDSKGTYMKVQVDGKDVAARNLEIAENGTSITLAPEFLEELDRGAHTITIVYADGSAKATFNIADENKTEPPTITMQPESQTANSGDKITFTIMASGTTPLICQWQVDKNDGNGWQNITGAVNASYTVTTDTVHNGYKFRCTVTNGAGSVTSDEATLTIAGADVPAEDGAQNGEEPETVKKKSNAWLWITVAAVAVIGIAAAGVIVFRNRKYYND